MVELLSQMQRQNTLLHTMVADVSCPAVSNHMLACPLFLQV